MAPPEQYAPGNTPPKIVEDWAFLGHLTVQQDERLQEFRTLLQDHPATRENIGKASDLQLLRFLRAREFSIKKAMRLVLDDVEWRKEIAGKKINLQSFPTILPFIKNRLIRLAGRDKNGRVVLVLRNGEFYPRKVPDIIEVVNIFICYMEMLTKLVYSLGFSEFVAIADMKGWSLSENFSLPVSQLLAQMLQDRYPETLRYAFVINNPFAFSAAWQLISPFLEDRVKAKVHVWGRKTERLLEYIDAQVLVKEFGGEHEPYPCPDEFLAPLFEGKVAQVASTPYAPISWIDETPMPSSPLSSGASIKSPKSGEDGFSDYEEDDDGGEAKVISTVSQLNVDGKPSTASDKPEKKQKKSMRRVIGRMFSARSRKPTSAASEAESSTDGDSIPAPQVPLSPTPEERPMEVIPKKPRPKVAVFGATGKTGKALVMELLNNNNDVTAFVRVNGSKLAAELVQRADSQDPKKPRLTIVVGDVSNLLDMERVVEDCDAVVCTMGTVPALTGNAAEFLPSAISHIMDAMEKLKVRRLVAMSSAHASQSWWEQGAGVINNLTKPIYWKNHYQHVAKMEDEIRARGAKGTIDFTIVRPGTLTDLPAGGAIRCEEGFVFPDFGPGEISRGDLVKFLMTEALDTKAESSYCGKGVAISKAT